MEGNKEKQLKRQVTKRSVPIKKHELKKQKFNNVLAENYALSLMEHTRKTLNYESINYIVKMTVRIKI